VSVSIENLNSQHNDTSKTLMQHMQVLQDQWLNATSAHRRARWISPGLREQRDGYIRSITNSKPSQTPTTKNSFEHATVSMNGIKPSAIQPRKAIFEVVARSCGLRCQCVCHEQRLFRSSAWLRPFFGSLFVSPNLLRTCRLKACQARMARVAYTYAFPFWFLDRVFTASITTSTAKGPELLIRLMRIRAPESAIFRTSGSGPLLCNGTTTVKALLDHGKASVLDTTASGLTILHVGKTMTLKRSIIRLITLFDTVRVAMPQLDIS